MAEVSGDTNRTIVLLLLLLQLPRQGHPQPSRHPRWEPQSVSSGLPEPRSKPCERLSEAPHTVPSVSSSPRHCPGLDRAPRLGCGSSFRSAFLLSTASPPRPTSLDFLRGAPGHSAHLLEEPFILPPSTSRWWVKSVSGFESLPSLLSSSHLFD